MSKTFDSKFRWQISDLSDFDSIRIHKDGGNYTLSLANGRVVSDSSGLEVFRVSSKKIYSTWGSFRNFRSLTTLEAYVKERLP